MKFLPVWLMVLECIFFRGTHAGDKFFFNETSLMQVTSATIPLKQGFEFGFRTCHGGILLYQSGAGDDYISLLVHPGTVDYNISTNPPHFTPSRLILQWKINGKEESVHAGSKLDQNYALTVIFNPGSNFVNATLKIDGPTKYSAIVPKTVLDFQSSGPLYAGGSLGNISSSKGFLGCIESGNNIALVLQGSINVNNASCPLDTQFGCNRKKCDAGYTGYYCEINFNECSSSPCHGTSTCIDGVNSFTCKCGQQWTGSKCEQFLGSICDLQKPCKNGGICKPTADKNNYTCTCQEGWTGMNCETAFNPCNLAPCLNGGICRRMSNGSNSFNCTCQSGFTGITCETNINDCSLSSCVHGQCVDGVNNFTCNCTRSGYKGQRCDEDINECDTSPCLNGATCTNYPNTYHCKCKSGYDGKNCHQNIDECSSRPCLNGGICKDGVNEFNCSCPIGYSGLRCETNIDDCVNNNCTQYQNCIDLINTYSCRCKPGFTGSSCTVDILECSSNPCKNNGSCVEGMNGYNCTCLPRFNGTHCEFDNVDDCTSNPCLHNGTCYDGVAQFNCSCVKGYGGKRCELKRDRCNPSPCDQGTCTIINDSDYNCTCALGFTGRNCSVNIDDCQANSCVQNATCVDGINNHTCQCPAGYRGDFCQIDIDECASNPCKNDAVCSNRIGRYLCDCLSGYNGTQCENNIDDCPYHGCNNGTCEDGINNYTCRCNAGFEGRHCEKNIDECLNSSSCLNGGTCQDTVGSYHCACNEFTNGTRCELDINECANKTLCNTGHCQNKLYTGYKCFCSQGWTGPNCYENINECTHKKKPCKNGAVCIDGVDEYTCVCTAGWEGKNCDQDINECDLGFCQNGATCQNGDGSYNCTCVPGYTDYNCSTDIDECADKPCENGATCNDHVNFYNCSCVPGYTGQNCSIDINECASSPCLNNATCFDLVNQFNCSCSANFTGRLCEYPISRCRPGNPCLNNGTCVDQGLDNYTCSCTPGFGGENCVNVTTISVNGSSSMAFDVGKSVLTVSLQFRTTLKYGVLAVDSLETFSLQLKDNKLEVRYGDKSGSVGADANLTDGRWHRVLVNVTSNALHTIVDNASCTDCELTVVRSSQTNLKRLLIGGATGNSQSLIGCLRAVEIDGVTIVPTQSNVELVNVIIGCERVPVCQPAPCNNGMCVDEWLQYRCECNRPWTGHQCNTTFIAGTFGAKSPLNSNSARRKRRSVLASVTSSFAKFQSLTTFSVQSELSFFLRTRESEGLIAFLTGNPGSADHLTVVLSSGVIVVQSTIGNTVKSITLNSSVNDGAKHFVSISANQSKVDNSTFPGVTLSASISLSRTFLGGLENWSEFPDKVVLATHGLRGCIQDVRLNNKLFLFYKSPTSLDSYLLLNASGLGEGCPGENTCGLVSPCGIRGTCQDIWNDYQCACNRFYGGKNCSLYGCSLVKPCAAGGRCLDVENGQFECVHPATFNASLSRANFMLTPNVSLQPRFSFNIRTRQSDAVIFSSFDGNKNLVVRLDNGAVNITYSLDGPSTGNIVSGKRINNGVWHNVLFNVTNRSSYLTIDGTIESFSGVFSAQALVNLLGSSSINIGKTTQIPFKGCLDNLRVGGVLLPFKPYYNSSFNVSHVTPLKPLFGAVLTGVSNGCHSDDVCTFQPCIRGNCSDKWNAYQCACPEGYAGPVCNNTANMTCAHQPCMNNASCQNNRTAHEGSATQVSDYGTDRFVCRCLPGYTGRQCGQVTDECSPSTCKNGGNCTDLHLDYKCACVVGFTGKECQTNIDECVGHSCLNNATCVDGVNEYTCNCTKGFNGSHCKLDIDECHLQVCYSIGTVSCNNTVGSYECTCNQGYYGRNCQYNATQWCALGKPCIHGNCSGNSTGFYCACAPGWEGKTCNGDIHECAHNPCNHNGTCVDSHSPSQTFFPGYRCNCDVNWMGSTCDTFVDPCDARPCVNGSCSRIAYNKYKCNCTEGFGNMNCSGLTKYCEPNPCRNGPCVPMMDDYSCQCEDGYIGKNCSELRNKCDSNPCQNGGTCETTASGYECSCKPSFTSTNCETENFFCANNSCEHEAECIAMPEHRNYSCNCTEKFSGAFCETIVVEPPLPRTADEPVELIIGIVVACVLLILLVLIVVLLWKKRSGNGTYSPSKQEMNGGRVELNSMLKPPNLERLI